LIGTRQTIDGFGASATGCTANSTAAQADTYFSPTTGLGLSLLRIRVIAGTEDADCGCVANNKLCRCETGTRSQIVSGDLQVEELAAARGDI
jgi:O-glycosyl hydrolase